MSADASGPDQPSAAGMLAGLKVLDIGTWIAGPAATTVLADLGADVIKIEPLGGDPYRALGEGPHALPSAHNYFWILTGRNKRSLAVDLKHERAREILDPLIARSDVLVTNFRPQLADGLGLGWERVHALNPALIYGQITGYGETGPDAAMPGYDTTAWWSRSGLADHVRAPDARPAMSAPGMGDHATAMSLFGGIMAALWARERGAPGQKVSTSLFANGLWSNGMLMSLHLAGASLPERTPETAVANALAAQYETADGRWLQLTLLNEAKEWPRLLQVLDAETLNDDPRFADPLARREQALALYAALAERFRSLDATTARERLATAGIPAAMLSTFEDLVEDPQAIAADILTEPEHPTEGWERTINSPLWFSGGRKRKPRYAPRVGEHSEQVLEELGLDGAAIAALQEAGVVRQHHLAAEQDDD